MTSPAASTSDRPTMVVLVDEADRKLGVAEKLAAHRGPGLLHRALSAFVFDPAGRLILQRRAAGKYHFAMLWSNSCCTHPRPDETVIEAGERRLLEELGLRCELTEIGTFVYWAADVATGLIEHELDHVLIGRSSAEARPDPEEVDDVLALHLDDLTDALKNDPGRFTPWLPDALAVLRRSELPDWASGRRPRGRAAGTAP